MERIKLEMGKITSIYSLQYGIERETGRVKALYQSIYNTVISEMAEQGYELIDDKFVLTNHNPKFIHLSDEDKELVLLGNMYKYNQIKNKHLITEMIERNRRLAINDYQEVKSFRNVLSGNTKTNYILPTKKNIQFSLKADKILDELRENPYLLHDIDKAFFKENYYEIMDIIYSAKINIQAKCILNKYAFNKLKSRFEDVEDMLVN
ncbi:MAG: hypothetical protein ACLRFL_03310 [Clostridia bacterium]